MMTARKLGAAQMPEWTESMGGREKWANWAEGQVSRCETRAKKWLKRKGSSSRTPGIVTWRAAIKAAIHECEGQGRYSKLPLSLNHEEGHTFSMWPSVEHLKDPATAKIALETRLVNDMATIMNETEFKAMVGHLCKAMGVEPHRLDNAWHPERSFSAKLENDPPLPS